MEDSHRLSNTLTLEELDVLRSFFGAYFHQDWTLDASDPDHIVKMFLDDAARSYEELVLLARLIVAIASRAVDDAALERALFAELQCYYLPSADGLSAREWLRHVSSLLLSLTYQSKK